MALPVVVMVLREAAMVHLGEAMDLEVGLEDKAHPHQAGEAGEDMARLRLEWDEAACALDRHLATQARHPTTNTSTLPDRHQAQATTVPRRRCMTSLWLVLSARRLRWMRGLGHHLDLAVRLDMLPVRMA
jgi:hypothetical protein